jgi:hypothetical protein
MALNPIPSLQITTTGGANLGRCYNASYFQVVSTKKLTDVQIRQLRDMGFLGYGQEFLAGQPLEVDPKEYVDTTMYNVAGIHKLYIYKCESRVDSSD